MTRATRSTAGLRDLLASLGALATASDRRLDLAAPGGRAGTFIARLLLELAALSQTPEMVEAEKKQSDGTAVTKDNSPAELQEILSGLEDDIRSAS